jgi:long-chain acyl-CoA synthetase
MRAEVLLQARALRSPEKVAIISGAEQASFAGLAASVARVAAGLAQLGIGPGDRIVLYLPNGTAFVELAFAAFSLGAIAVPMTTRLTGHELAYICGDCEPKIVALHASQAALVEGIAGAPGPARRVVVGGTATDALPFAALRETPAAPLPEVPVEAEDAVIMYTSGTTGRPKGAIITHANLVIQHYMLNALDWGLSAEDRFLVTTPLAHRTGFARMANALMLGATLVAMPKFEAEAAAETIARHGITVVGMVPTVCRMLLPAIAADASRFASLRRMVVTGEAFPVDLKRRLIELLPQVRLASFFAMTEVGSVTGLDHAEQFTHPASVGRPSPGVEIRLVDERGAPVAPGEVGELLVRSGPPGQATTMRGYFRRDAETARAIRNGWLHTGDMARQDAEGYIYIVDRKKDMVLSGGFNIYTKEVEQALIACPEVLDAAVIGVPDPIYGEAVAAFVEAAPGSGLTAQAVIDHCRTLIAGYKKPRHVVVVDALPRNSLGKVLKNELRQCAHATLTVASGNGTASPHPV